MIKICSLIVFLLSAFASTHAAECGPRVRKSWRTLTSIEKTTFINAVQLGMKQGHHIKWVEMHTEYQSSSEAHKTGVFMYWHRMFLLGYENMLRSLGPEYACVTLPYWDYVTDNADYLAGRCNSIESCSVALQDLGGTTYGIPGVYQQTINNLLVDGDICATALFRSFCQDSSRQDSVCNHCVLRGDSQYGTWQESIIPTEANFVSVSNQIFVPPISLTANVSASYVYPSWLDFSKSVENGVHNNVHGTLMGAMGTYQSPSDIVFFLHHATIDLFSTIHYNCQVGRKLSDEEKKTNQYVWQDCKRNTPSSTGSQVFYATDIVSMRVGIFGVNSIQAFDSKSSVYQFFTSLPTMYYKYVDAGDLGESSYTYQYSDLIRAINQNCGKNTSANTFLQEQYYRVNPMNQNIDKVPSGMIATFILNDVRASAPPARPVSPREDRTTLKQYERRLVYNYMKSLTYYEMMLAVFREECHGGCKDYNPKFKKNWNINSSTAPRCVQILSEMAKQSIFIEIPKWRQIFGKYYNCPTAKYATLYKP